MSAFPDVVALWCAQLTAGLVRTVETLPPNFAVPIVQIAEIPGGAALHKPYNAPPISERYDVDVYVFGPKDVPEGVAEVRDLAHEVRDFLNAWSAPGVVVEEFTRPSRRPDYNPNIVRFGMVFRITAARMP